MRTSFFMGDFWSLGQNGGAPAPAAPAPAAPAPAAPPPAAPPPTAPPGGMAPMPPSNGGMPPGNGGGRPGGRVRRGSRRGRGFHPRVIAYPYPFFSPYYPGYYPQQQQTPTRFMCTRLEEESEEAGEDVFECEAEFEEQPVQRPFARFYGAPGFF